MSAGSLASWFWKRLWPNTPGLVPLPPVCGDRLRHRYLGKATCCRCGVPNPRAKKMGKNP